MKINGYLSFILVSQFVLSATASANVRFIIEDGDEISLNSVVGKTLDDKYHEACKEKGFSIKTSSCTGNTMPGFRCPYSPEYVDKCCDIKYSYAINSACHYNATPSSELCGGRFACVCDPMEYPKGIGRESCTGKFAYDEINYCVETYIDSSGTEHETRYFKGCTCASNYARCNSSYRLRGSGDSCSYNGAIYYSSCSCETGYNKLCLASGAKHPSDYCLFKGKKYYRECISIEDDNKLDDAEMNSTDQ